MSTFSNCHVLFDNLHSFVHASLHEAQLSQASMRWSVPCRINATLKWAMLLINILPHNRPYWCQVDRGLSSTNSITTNAVDDTKYCSASAPSWTKNLEADGHKLSAVRLTGLKSKFYLPCLHLACPLGLIPSKFCENTLQHKSHRAIARPCLRDSTFSRFHTIPECDGRTNGRTRDDNIYRASKASREKNYRTCHVFVRAALIGDV